MVCFSGLLKNIQFFFVTTVILFVSFKFMRLPKHVADCPSDPRWLEYLNSFQDVICTSTQRSLLKYFNYTQAIWKNWSVFSLVLVDSLYSNASWRIHTCSPVLAFILPSSSPGCALYSPWCNSSRDNLCATEGKVNADNFFFFLHLLLFKRYVGTTELCSESVIFVLRVKIFCLLAWNKQAILFALISYYGASLRFMHTAM